MITTRGEFENETAWERTVIALAVPAIPLSSSGTDLDLRTRNITIEVTCIVGSEKVDELRDALLPLVFGAGWKILDLALELALATAKILPANSGRWTIKEKAHHGTATIGDSPGLLNSMALRKTLGPLYASTVEIRHALVHRRVQVEHSTKSLKSYDSAGAPLAVFTYEEQLAFCRFVQRMAQAIIDDNLTPRAELDLFGQFSLLQKHHGIATTSRGSIRPPVRVVDSFPANGVIEVRRYMSVAQKTFPGVTYVDIQLYLQDGQVLTGELEAAPHEEVSINFGNLPEWLRFS